MRTLRFALLILAGVANGSCRSAGQPAGPSDLQEPGSMHVLFIGNSLTYWNDLPAVVAALAEQMQESTKLRVGAVAFPDYNLEDHWQDGRARQELSRDGWEYVVLQQGPSSLSENRNQLIASAEKFSEAIRSKGAVPALYAAWPQEQRKLDFIAAEVSYRLAAEEVNGKLLPVSTAWRIAMELAPEIRLYSDGLHPNTAGTYLTAVVIYCTLYGRPASGLPDSIGKNVRVSAAAGAVLRTAADSARALTHR